MSTPWRKLTSRGKISRLKRELRWKDETIAGLRQQVRHAAAATNEMASHARMMEVMAGHNNAGDRALLRDQPFQILSPALSLSDSSKKLIEADEVKQIAEKTL